MAMRMGMEQVHSQRMEQKLILAPRMIQSMEVLQMPIMKLEERIQEELSDNPVMELREAGPDEDAPDAELHDSDGDADASSDPDASELVIDDTNNESDFDRLDALNRDWENHFNEDHRPSRNSIEEASNKKHDAMQNLASRPESLVDHLHEQLMLLDNPPEHFDFIQYLIDNLDERGYLSSTLDLLARRYATTQSLPEENGKKRDKENKPFDLEEAEKVLARLERMKPALHSRQELRQMLLMGEPPKHREFYHLLIDALDEHAELKSSLELLAEWHDPSLTIDDAEEALDVIHQLDPPGVGARDLIECLLLQLTPEMPHVDLVRQLIVHHLEDIQHNRLPAIERRTGADLATIQESIEELRHLNPRPAAPFAASANSYVTPDVVVELNEEGEYVVRLLDDWVPEVYVPLEFRHMVKDPNIDQKTRDYLRHRIQRVDWLREAIEQRRSTLKKVTDAIVQHQRAFFDKGPEFIEPLKMQQIADQVGVHVTTVSRAVDKKYAETPRGVFPLKRFFGGGKVVNGEEIAWENIKRKLLEIIENEDKANPLSDEDLMKAMEAAKHPIKRRTVTKYRKMLDIPSSRERKDWSRV